MIDLCARCEHTQSVHGSRRCMEPTAGLAGAVKFLCSCTRYTAPTETAWIPDLVFHDYSPQTPDPYEALRSLKPGDKVQIRDGDQVYEVTLGERIQFGASEDDDSEIRAEVLADAEAAWKSWAAREYGLPTFVPPENAAPLLEGAFQAGYLAAKGIDQ